MPLQTAPLVIMDGLQCQHEYVIMRVILRQPTAGSRHFVWW